MHHVTDDITLFQQHNIMHNAVWDLAMQGVADLHFEGIYKNYCQSTIHDQDP